MNLRTQITEMDAELNKSGDKINCLLSQLNCKNKEIQALKSFNKPIDGNKHIIELMLLIDKLLQDRSDPYLQLHKELLIDDPSLNTYILQGNYQQALTSAIVIIHKLISLHMQSSNTHGAIPKRQASKSSISRSTTPMPHTAFATRKNSTKSKISTIDSQIGKPIFETFSKKNKYFDPYLQYGGPSM